MHTTQGSAKGNNKEINAQNKAAMKLSSEEKKTLHDSPCQ